MPSLIKIRVIEGRDLPGMDRNLHGEAFTDSYVEVILGKQHQDRTQTIRKTLNPVWEEEFRFEVVDDSFLQNTPLEFKVMDQNISSSDLIGVVYVDLNPLIMRTAHDSDKDLVIEGWFPLYETLQGIQGSLLIHVKLQFIGNDNPFRDSAAGVQFFSTSSLSPSEFVIQEVLGLVVDLVVEDDPEMSWHDYFRAAKSSNDNRMRVLYRLSSTVRKEVGKKVIEAGGNAVLGYSSHFDAEGDSGIVVRAYGTACILLKVGGVSSRSGSMAIQLESSVDAVGSPGPPALGAIRTPSLTTAVPTLLPTASTPPVSSVLLGLTAIPSATYQNVHTQNYRDDPHPDAGVSGHGSRRFILEAFGPSSEKVRDPSRDGAVGARYGSLVGGTEFQSEVELLSLQSFDEHVRIRFGGLVLAKSVKFLGKLQSTLSDQETRESWWEELRDEIRNHASTLCCSHVVGYSETCTIHGDVCILIATGTAAVVKGFMHQYIHSSPAGGDGEYEGQTKAPASSALLCGTAGDVELPDLVQLQGISTDDPENMLAGSEQTKKPSRAPVLPDPAQISRGVSDGVVPGHGSAGHVGNIKRHRSWDATAVPGGKATGRRVQDKWRRPCSIAHVPYNRSRAPFAFMRLVPCLMCGRKWVPEIIVTTVQPSASIPVRGQGRLLEVVVHRARKAASGEQDAVKMSEVLPFVEYDIQRQLMLKLKVMGMNAAMGYNFSLQFGASMIIATATCTAVYLEPLPPPPSLQLSANIKEMKLGSDLHMTRIQAQIEKLYEANKLQLEAAIGPKPRRRLLHSRSLSVDNISAGSNEWDRQSAASSSSSSSSSSSEGTCYSSLESPSSSDDSDDGEDGRGMSSSGAKKITSPSPSEDMRVRDRARRRSKQKKKILFEDDRRPVLIEIDEETDLDLMNVLVDCSAPEHMHFVNTQVVPGLEGAANGAKPNSLREIKVIRRVKLPGRGGAGGLRGGLNHVLAKVFQDAYARLCFSLRDGTPCEILGMRHSVTIIDEDTVEIMIICMAHYVDKTKLVASKLAALHGSGTQQHMAPASESVPSGAPPLISALSHQVPVQPPVVSSLVHSMLEMPSAVESRERRQTLFASRQESLAGGGSVPNMAVDFFGAPSPRPTGVMSPSNPARTRDNSTIQPIVLFPHVYLTTLCYIPSKRILRYLGPLQLHFIKESWTVSGEGKLGSFVHNFLSEVDAATRAQVVALGGNALLCHRIVPVESGSRTSRNQAYSMLSIYGDVVLVQESPG